MFAVEERCLSRLLLSAIFDYRGRKDSFPSARDSVEPES